jgi:hypothetical protein
MAGKARQARLRIMLRIINAFSTNQAMIATVLEVILMDTVFLIWIDLCEVNGLLDHNRVPNTNGRLGSYRERIWNLMTGDTGLY